MTIFFTSDHHFNHARISELANRPFKATKEKTVVQVMNDFMIKRWNETVGPDDTVFHLGDLALGKIDELPPILAQLNGKITLIAGNHDRNFIKGHRSGGIEPLEWNARYEEWGINAALSTNLALAGWAANEPVMLSHFPYEGDHFDEDRFDDVRATDSGLPILHGHTHSSNVISYSSKGTLQIHIGVDSWGFRPVSYERITEIIRALDTSV